MPKSLWRTLERAYEYRVASAFFHSLRLGPLHQSDGSDIYLMCISSNAPKHLPNRVRHFRISPVVAVLKALTELIFVVDWCRRFYPEYLAVKSFQTGHRLSLSMHRHLFMRGIYAIEFLYLRFSMKVVERRALRIL